jgi:hypothetical protein
VIGGRANGEGVIERPAAGARLVRGSSKGGDLADAGNGGAGSGGLPTGGRDVGDVGGTCGGGGRALGGAAARARPLALVISLWAIRARAPMVRPGSRTSPRVSWVTYQDGRYASIGRPGLTASHHS